MFETQRKQSFDPEKHKNFVTASGSYAEEGMVALTTTFKVLHVIFWSFSLFWVALETGLGCFEIGQTWGLESGIF